MALKEIYIPPFGSGLLGNDIFGGGYSYTEDMFRYRLADDPGNHLYLSKKFKFLLAPYTQRLGIENYYQRSGGYVAGDREIPTRAMNATFHITSENDQDAIDEINELIGFFYGANSPFYLEDMVLDRRMNVDLRSSTPAWRETLVYRFGDNARLDLECLDGLWEDQSEINTNAYLRTTESMYINNSGDFLTYPVITMTAHATLQDFSIENQTTGSKLEISITGFTSSKTMVFDAINGTIYLDEVESSYSVLRGGFPLLAPGNNQIVYTSGDGDCELSFAWRKRFAF
jgi:hypothetical protein